MRLAECGLLTTYSVQLQGTAVDFSVQIKYQFLLLQFVKSLQSVLLKIPSVPGHEYSREISTQTMGESSFTEVTLTDTSTSKVSEQLSSLVEACVFTPTEDQLEWVDDDEGRELKGEITRTTDIIMTCHPATLAAITTHNFVATPVPEVAVNSADSVLIKPCAKGSVASSENCNHAEEEESRSDSLAGTENKTEPQNTTETSYTDSATETSLENVTVMDLKPFITTSATGVLSNSIKVAFGSKQTMESLVLKTYGEEHSKECDDISGSASNIMHIVVATASPESTSVKQKECEEAEEEDGDTGSSTTMAIFICEVCEKTFQSACSLEVHQNENHRTRGQCDMCHQRFGSVQSLQEHCQTEHEGRGCFSCLLCGKRFMTKLSYRRHMDIHGGKKGAVCDMCGKTFSRPDYLQKHYMTHTGDRPYHCAVCPRQFISRSQLKVHQRTHTGIKEHVCDMCNKAFSRGDKLKEHMLRHLNIKRFHCSLCERDYAEKRDLTKHLKVHMT
ncbi:zinc finger protein 26-like isoform X2 [Zootermopsis nevadensis]|uniref:zinc finger protein 26-like isoform X2 n=1 Tax=Zootermopsis nevadensis TaxID=136037 RepID=UPI000B8E30DA|nr:zinc finger protein 26-like isoform X2 [Zootermopsis nevadensis]